MPFYRVGASRMSDGGSFFHCSVKVVGRSAGRSAVAAAAYRLGERLYDERTQQVSDYSRRGGVLDSFTVAPTDSPEWVLTPERLWNAAEAKENRVNSRVAREVELALPAFLPADERRKIVEAYADELVDRYGVAVTAALHAPGKGDDRNFHAHILFTTREIRPDGWGLKTRVLDDAKTGPKEVDKLRQLAADLINESLKANNSDVRVDHRSFKDRGIAREPTTHLGPAASGIERRGELSDRGDINRDAARINSTHETGEAELAALDSAISQERYNLTQPPKTIEAAHERLADEMAPFDEAIRTRGHIADVRMRDGVSWWKQTALLLAEKAFNVTRDLLSKMRDLWQDRMTETPPEPGRDDDDKGRDR